MGNKITYKDAAGTDQPLVRSEWNWPDAGDFVSLRNVARDAADAVTAFHVKRASTPVQVTPAEQAEAARKGPGALEKLYAARRAITDNLIAFDAAQKLAVRESGPSTGLRAIEASLPLRVRGLAKVDPLNPTNVALDGRLLDALARKTGVERTQFLLELRNGQHAATARALLRTADVAPELLPLQLDEPTLAGITEAVARREAPEGMAELDELRRAAAVARAAWQNAAKMIAEGLPVDERRKALGAAFEALDHSANIADPNWPEFVAPARVASR